MIAISFVSLINSEEAFSRVSGWMPLLWIQGDLLKEHFHFQRSEDGDRYPEEHRETTLYFRSSFDRFVKPTGPWPLSFASERTVDGDGKRNHKVTTSKNSGLNFNEAPLKNCILTKRNQKKKLNKKAKKKWLPVYGTAFTDIMHLFLFGSTVQFVLILLSPLEGGGEKGKDRWVPHPIPIWLACSRDRERETQLWNKQVERHNTLGAEKIQTAPSLRSKWKRGLLGFLTSTDFILLVNLATVGGMDTFISWCSKRCKQERTIFQNLSPAHFGFLETNLRLLFKKYFIFFLLLLLLPCPLFFNSPHFISQKWTFLCVCFFDLGGCQGAWPIQVLSFPFLFKTW